MKKEKLINLLKLTIELLEKDDSMEGRIQYTFDPDNPNEFLVDACVRHGNSEGQGGCVVFTAKRGIRVVEEGTDFDGKFKAFE